ncbi:MAG TPA: GAF domain-containing protein [Vicinamibacterales bacterium]|nr:GAF domain-containing protein [Vicinamibacterales bacterium]
MDAIPADPATALTTWREAYRRGPAAPTTFNQRDTGRSFALTPVPVWRTSADARGAWMRQHLGPLAQMAGFLAGAVILVALGSRGMTGALMTLALVATAIANGGPMYGAELSVPLIGPLLLVVSWLVTPLSFPVIGLAVLHFPTRAELLDRHRWIYGAMAAAVAPMLVISLVAALFLLGAEVALAPLAWLSTHGWLFDASFAIALAANVLIVIEGIGRYRHNLDANERRRIQIVVYTGVPAVFAYAIKVGVPLLSSLAGRRMELPWPIEALLQAIVLLPALALPYAVAVKHVLSPRTVLRRGLQYALARRTLSVLVALPIAALLVALASDRDRPLGAIILGQPLFYLVCVGLAAAGFRYRDQAQRWLDLRFFRAEYDAREILVSLANRVPYENDPTQLVALVLSQIDNAIHPESLAVLAGEDETLHIIGALRSLVGPLPRDSGLATVLRWSDQPLEIFLDDERGHAARLPGSDRLWLAEGGVALLVPIFAGSGDARALVGLIALGQKRSEEPYTAEDRKLLSGIAAQMSVALDLSRLRKQASTGVRTGTGTGTGTHSGTGTRAGTPTLTPTMVAPTGNFAAPSLAMCPVCQRCFDLHDVRAADGTVVCPDDATMLQPVIGMPPVVDGKYRVDAVIGRGGMGAVFRARDLRLERDVAIKIVRADLVADPDSRARFQREAQIVARLQHPAIVTVFDYGNLPGRRGVPGDGICPRRESAAPAQARTAVECRTRGGTAVGYRRRR